MPLASVMYAFSADCPKCRQPVPLNGASEAVLCGSCQTPMQTPPELWRTILGEATGVSLGMAEGDGQNTTMMLSNWAITVKGTYGRLGARCEPDCKTPHPSEALEELLAKGGGDLHCGACGKKASVRPAPSWFREMVHPTAVGLVAESMATGQLTRADPEAVRFHCYHCGGAMPLDGSARALPCTYCHTEVMVPDDIWVRLHPAATVDRWFALLDLGDTVGVVPEDCYEFCDLTVEANGNIVLAYHADDDGDAGHPCRVVLANRSGLLLWQQDGVEFSDYTTLFVAPGTGHIVLVDKEGGFVRFLDAANGDPIRTLAKPAEDSRMAADVYEHDGVAVDWDGSLVVRKYWPDTRERALRRFGPDGARLPLWPGLPTLAKEGGGHPSFARLADRPVVLPDDALFGFGWDGAFYVLEEEGTSYARFGRDGVLQHKGDTAIQNVKEVRAFDVSSDGVLHVLFEHSVELGDSRYAHVARVHADGRSGLWLGPHVEGSPLLGPYDDRLEVMPDGTAYLGNALDSLRIVGPDGQVVWKSNATARHEEWLAEELDKARKGKRSAADREG